jgi:hypothetical protein
MEVSANGGLRRSSVDGVDKEKAGRLERPALVLQERGG